MLVICRQPEKKQQLLIQRPRYHYQQQQQTKTACLFVSRQTEIQLSSSLRSQSSNNCNKNRRTANVNHNNRSIKSEHTARQHAVGLRCRAYLWSGSGGSEGLTGQRRRAEQETCCWCVRSRARTLHTPASVWGQRPSGRPRDASPRDKHSGAVVQVVKR